MNIELAPENCGLVIVDMQAEGCERHGPTLKPVVKNVRNSWIAFAPPTEKSSMCNRSVPKIIPNSPYSARNIRCSTALRGRVRGGLKLSPGETIVKKFSHDCFFQPGMEYTLKSSTCARAGTGRRHRHRREQLRLSRGGRLSHSQLLRDRAGRLHPWRGADGQTFALAQFRSPAYNFNITVANSAEINFRSGFRISKT